MSKVNWAVLISGSGSNLQSIIDAEKKGDFAAHVACVISNKESAYGLERARQSDIPAYVLKGEKTSADLLEILEKHNVEWIILAGYLGIIRPEIIEKFRNRIINIHPSLIPKHCGKGYYGHRVHESVLESGDTETGVTLHYVDEGIDTGQIIRQEKVPVLKDDTVETLADRVLKVEHRLIVEVIGDIVQKQ